MRDLELSRYGLQILPYEGGAVFTRDGGYLGMFRDHDANRREFARFSARDAEAYDRYSRDVMQHCRFIRPLLMRTPPDPARFRPRDLAELAWIGRKVMDLSEAQICRHDPVLDHVDIRFSRRIFRKSGDQGLSGGLGHHRHRAGADVAGLGLCAVASLHGRCGRQCRRLGLCARRHGRDHAGPHPVAGSRRRRGAHRQGGQAGSGAAGPRHRGRDSRMASRSMRRASSPTWMPSAPSCAMSTRPNCPRNSSARCGASRRAARRAS